MKRVALFFAICLLSITLFSSCEKETILTVNQSYINFSNSGGYQTIVFTSNKPWTVASNQTWCKVSPSTGDEASCEFDIICEANNTYDSKNCTVTITCAELTKQIMIEQAAGNGLIVSQKDYNINNEAQQINIEVKANVKFTVEIDSRCQDWIKYSTTKGLTTSIVVLDISNNETYDNRAGKVTIKQTDGKLSETVSIKQAQTDGLFGTQTDYYVYGEEQTLDVVIKTNTEFEVQPEVSWIKYHETKALNTKVIVLWIGKNDSNKERAGKVTLRQKEGTLRANFYVHQKANSYDDPISFADENIKARIVDAFDTNNDGEVSYREAVAAKSIEGVFGAIKTYTSFDEFQYFTGVTEIPEKMFEKWRITSIVLPKSIRKIGESAFNECSSLSSPITIPEGVEKIEDSCFSGCTNITEIHLPETIKYIGYSSFKGCKKLRSIELPEKLTQIRSWAFHGCEALQSIVIPGSVQIIEECFPKCTGLTSVVIEEGVKSIWGDNYENWEDRGCFQGCINLKEVKLPESLEVLGAKVFQGCSSLASIKLPSGLKEIKEAAFANCSALSDVVIPESVSIIDGAFFVGSTMGSWGAFSNCSNLKSIILPTGLSQIGKYLFYGCSNLKEIAIPNTVSKIGRSAFAGCSNLTSIIVPDSVSDIEFNAFRDCDKLTEVSLPESITTLYEGTFYGCVSLKSVTIPKSVIMLSQSSYYSSGDGCFENCTNLETVVIPNSVVSIDCYCFEGCSSLKNIQLPESIKTLGWSVFKDCTNIESIALPQDLIEIYGSCFEGCTNLKNVNFPNSLNKIGHDAFRDCINITDLVIPNSVIEIESGVFWGCNKLSSIILPSELTYIGRGLFYNCKSLKHIVIPESVTSIQGTYFNTYNTRGQYGGAFENCENLTSIIIPKNVSEIGAYAFWKCSKLESISMLPSTPPSVDNNNYYTVFWYSSCPIYVPSDSFDAYMASDWGASYYERIRATQ